MTVSFELHTQSNNVSFSSRSNTTRSHWYLKTLPWQDILIKSLTKRCCRFYSRLGTRSKTTGSQSLGISESQVVLLVRHPRICILFCWIGAHRRLGGTQTD